MAIVLDLLDVDEVLSNEDDVIEIQMADAGMEDEINNRRANDGLRQHARPGHSGGGRLDGAHHENILCKQYDVEETRSEVGIDGEATENMEAGLVDAIFFQRLVWSEVSVSTAQSHGVELHERVSLRVRCFAGPWG